MMVKKGDLSTAANLVSAPSSQLFCLVATDDRITPTIILLKIYLLVCCARRNNKPVSVYLVTGYMVLNQSGSKKRIYKL
jgi:hypothetical protein